MNESDVNEGREQARARDGEREREREGGRDPYEL